ncbi:MAG: ATP-binding cassette domain-containing protein [Hyphomicrobium sp.]|nr:ATP-binding cassette domain-containing protein [Hyphomicrobium sp.]
MDQTVLRPIMRDVQVMPIAGDALVVRRDGRTLLDRAALSIAHGAGVTVIIGPNGAGKSLLIRTLAGLVVPDLGRVTWAGSPPDRRRARRTGFVLQRPVMLRRTALDNLVYVLKLHGHNDAAGRVVAMQHLADHGLARVAATNAQRLSGGEQQRLALLRALVLEPEVLFLDEPAANLDPASTLAIERQLNVAVEKGLRVVLVTQDLAQARRLADEIVFLHKGRVLEKGEAHEFFRAPATAEARAFLAGDLVL